MEVGAERNEARDQILAALSKGEGWSEEGGLLWEVSISATGDELRRWLREEVEGYRSEARDRVVEVLSKGDLDEAYRIWERSDSFPKTVARRLRQELEALVWEGIVGRTYTWEELGGEPGECVGRVYWVWLKTPETAESDRRWEELDREWAAFTSGMFGHDRALLDRWYEEDGNDAAEQIAAIWKGTRGAHS